MTIPECWAHTPNDVGKPQSMLEHTAGVEKKSVGFAKDFGAETLASWAAWLHDVGKYGPPFQKYLLACHAAKLAGRKPPKSGSAEHKIAGTRLALEILPPNLREMVAACVLGHHGGLIAFSKIASAIAAKQNQKPIQDESITKAHTDLSQLSSTPTMHLPASAGTTRLEWEMFIRFLFSCLVDADGLDTEEHFKPHKNALRQTRTFADAGSEWLEKFTGSQNAIQAKADATRVNEVRHEVYELCLKAASLPPGLFSLTVPTGGGKTRSSLAFALKHALEHERSRIIYAIPYTSIIDQTAAEFRKILGDDAVLEHHSAMDDRAEPEKVAKNPDEETNEQAEDAKDQQRKLDAENWNAPLIVTTTVQLFESLFSSRTGRCRKVHNIAKSVIILDEVQTLPPHLLLPLLDCLKILIARYGVTVVLCTATQPAITGNTPFLDATKGLGPPTSIIPASLIQTHFKGLKRVTYRVETEPWSWDRVACEIKSQDTSCLVVLNTKNNALDVMKALDDPNAHHLSTLLCGEHRRQVLADAKTALKAEREGQGPSIRLITTQVIEAGCDIDFPRVLRARGPLDRIIQAAGRCNREGKPDFLGDVLVFNPAEGKAPPGDYLTALQEAWMMISAGEVDFDNPEMATEFFSRFYAVLGPKGLDRPKAVMTDAGKDSEPVQTSRAALDFPIVARKMRLIDDDTTPVLVPYYRDYRPGVFPKVKYSKADYDALVSEIETQQALGKGLGRDLWKRLQSLTVAVRTQSLEGLPVSPTFNADAPEAIYVWHGVYSPVVGIGNTVDWDSSDLFC